MSYLTCKIGIVLTACIHRGAGPRVRGCVVGMMSTVLIPKGPSAAH